MPSPRLQSAQTRTLRMQAIPMTAFVILLITIFLLPHPGQQSALAGRATANSPVATSAQGYPSGQRPFLTSKPYAASYTQPLWINSFFDHKLPGYSYVENNTAIPSDLHDPTHAMHFLGTNLAEVNGSCTLGASCYSGHDGIDYNTGTQEIIAPADGVIRLGSESSACLVWIDHDASDPLDNTNDFSTLYMHLSSIGQAPDDQRTRPDRSPSTTWVKDDRIKAGQVVGISGNEPCGGTSDGAHLHFGIAAGAAGDRGNPQIFDPFGWWSATADPWIDSRLPALLHGSWQPARSVWAWAAPVNPGAGQPGAWDAEVLAQTDDTDASFQQFGPWTRRAILSGWNALLPNAAANVVPIGSGAWWSRSLQKDAAGTQQNWAIWGLHVPADGQYRIQAFLPNLPPGSPNATSTARYTVHIPTDDTTLSIWQSGAINQQATNAWHDIVDQNNQAVFALRANTVVLVVLSDVTGAADEAVLFDALRLRAETPVQPPPPPTATGQVGFAIDNSSSMREQGKINAVKAELPFWINQLTATGVRFTYALEPFANNTPAVQATTDAEQIKAWIAGLTANDNGIFNGECPEESLGAIAKLAPFVKDGNMLLFTDDLPFAPFTQLAPTFNALSTNKVKLHTIVLPKTCNFGSGNNPAGWLTYRFLSFISGGTYQSVTTDKTAAALQIVLSEMRAQGQLSVATRSATSTTAIQSTTAITYPIEVDSTITQMNALLNILSSTASLQLLRPDGATVSPLDADVVYTDSGSAQYYQISNPTPGTWSAMVISDGEYRFSTSAISTLQFAYLGDTRGTPGAVMELAARLNGPTASANFTLETRDGQPVAAVTLHDDGKLNDLVAGDGLYMGWFTPTQRGDLRMRVTGTTTMGGTFSRVDSRLIRVQGLRVTAPPARTVANGSTTTLSFTVANLDDTAQTYMLSATSNSGWIQIAPPASVTIAAGGSTTINVTIKVPANAAPNSIEKIWLTATLQTDQTIIGEGSVTLFTTLPEEAGSFYSLYMPLARK